MKHPWVWQISPSPRQWAQAHDFQCHSCESLNILSFRDWWDEEEKCWNPPLTKTGIWQPFMNHLWGSYSRELKVLPVECFFKVTCWNGFMKVCPSDVIFTFGIEVDGNFWLQTQCAAFSSCLPSAHAWGSQPPLTLVPKVSPLLSPGGGRGAFTLCIFFVPISLIFYLGCFVGHRWIHFIATIGELILLLCH